MNCSSARLSTPTAAANSHRITSFADPPHLTPVESHLCEKHRGVGCGCLLSLATLHSSLAAIFFRMNTSPKGAHNSSKTLRRRALFAQRMRTPKRTGLKAISSLESALAKVCDYTRLKVLWNEHLQKNRGEGGTRNRNKDFCPACPERSWRKERPSGAISLSPLRQSVPTTIAATRLSSPMVARTSVCARVRATVRGSRATDHSSSVISARQRYLAGPI